MWADTQERAELHGVKTPCSDEEEKHSGRAEDQRLGEKLESVAENHPKNCCVWGCVALFVLLFLFSVWRSGRKRGGGDDRDQHRGL